MNFVESIAFRGWKEFSKFSGFSIATLKLWNKKDPIPGLAKSAPGKAGVVYIPKEKGRDWILKRINLKA